MAKYPVLVNAYLVVRDAHSHSQRLIDQAVMSALSSSGLTERIEQSRDFAIDVIRVCLRIPMAAAAPQ